MSADVRLLRWPARDQQDFDELAERLNTIRRLARFAPATAVQGGHPKVPVVTGPEPLSHLEKAQELYAHRRARASMFGAAAEFLQDPVWDIMLDLFIAHEKGVAISISSACVASCVPPTTALRWLKALEQHKIVRCRRSDTDKRVRYVMLTIEYVEMMSRYLDTV